MRSILLASCLLLSLAPLLPGSPARAGTTVPAGTISEDTRWAVGNSPYVIEGGNLYIEGQDGPDGVTTLTIEAGVIVHMDGNHSIQVGRNDKGALVTEGEVDNDVVFDRLQAERKWGGIQFWRKADGSSVLRHTEVIDGGTGGAGIWLGHGTSGGQTITLDHVVVQLSHQDGIYQDGDAVMTDVFVVDSARHGISINGGAVDILRCDVTLSEGHDIHLSDSGLISGGSVRDCNPLNSIWYENASSVGSIEWSDNVFEDWGIPVSRVDPDVVDDLLTRNTIRPVPSAEVEIARGEVNQDATWQPSLGSPYRLQGRLLVQGRSGADAVTTLTLAPGMDLVMEERDGIQVGRTDRGVLVADAADGERIRFRGGSDVRGFWQGIQLWSRTREGTILRNVEVANAGHNGWSVYAGNTNDATIVMENVEIRESGDECLLVQSQGTMELTDILVDGCNGDGFVLDDGSIELIDSTAREIGGYGVRVGTWDGLTVSGCKLADVYHESQNTDTLYTGNTFSDWGRKTSRVNARSVGSLVTGNTISAVEDAKLEVWGGETIDTDTRWTNAAGPLDFVSGSLDVRGRDGEDKVTTLTLEPGVEIRMHSGDIAVGGSGPPGELEAIGTPGQPILFTSSRNNPGVGSWSGINVPYAGGIALSDVRIAFVDIGVDVYGSVNALERVRVARATTGVRFTSAEVPVGLIVREIACSGCDAAVRVQDTELTIEDSELTGRSWGLLNEAPGFACVDARNNWWGDETGPSGVPPTAGCETQTPSGGGSRVSEGVRFGSWDDAPANDCAGFAQEPEGSADNCPRVCNPSQADADGDGTGDACEPSPVLRVSSDPADGADFPSVGEAIEAVTRPGSRIEVHPGLGTYHEAALLDRAELSELQGLRQDRDGDGTAEPVIIDGGGGNALRVREGYGTLLARNLQLRGQRGVRAWVDTELFDMQFEAIGSEALRFESGNHRVVRADVGAGTPTGIRALEGTEIELERVSMKDLTSVGVDAGGRARLENVLIAGGDGADGVRVGVEGDVEVVFATIYDNTGAGIDNSQGGRATVDSSIVYANGQGDLLNVACVDVSWSDVGDPDCSSDQNRSEDPLLEPDYRLSADSPCLELGPPPESYDGDPTTDLDGNPRVVDHDGLGGVRSDCGAFERPPQSRAPGEVRYLRWLSKTTLTWDAEPDATSYHVYKGFVRDLGYSDFGKCADEEDPNLNDLVFDEFADPPAGWSFFHLITAEGPPDGEGTLGYATGIERSNFQPCVP